MFYVVFRASSSNIQLDRYACGPFLLVENSQDFGVG